ncbi:DUF3304 domain-containing protein [Chromobacterium vaccinii]|uniref:DUF3304 domain-containing protein n=1 Tax=Chromobacterium vaccinii TaxID=1108595 RepID=UPI0009E3803F|nr:DUF3304 domain-containing protein [Chromobacterium vaccinii]
MRILFFLSFIVILTGCKDEMLAVPVGAYNYTNHDISMAWADGHWVGGPSVNGGGGIAGSITLPRKYTPGTSVKLEWERSVCIHDTPECEKRDASGGFILTTKRKTVVVPPYDGETMAEVQVVLLPNDDARIYVGNMSLLHKEHPSHKEFGPLIEDGPRPLERIWPKSKIDALQSEKQNNKLKDAN